MQVNAKMIKQNLKKRNKDLSATAKKMSITYLSEKRAG
jgi:hypothetical protein